MTSDIEIYDSGNYSELVENTPPDNAKCVVYSIGADLKGNDIILVLSECEATNDHGINVRLTTQLILATSGNKDTSGIEIGENNAFNITKNMHHGVATKVGMFKCPSSWSLSKRYINFIAWSKYPLKIEQDFGRLQVMHIKA